MKKIFKFFAAMLITVSSFAFSSCDFFADAIEDTFKGEADTWLEVKVKYEKNGMKGDAKLAFFYTEAEGGKTGHSTNETRLKKDAKINSGLTILLSGKFTPIAGTGMNELAYYKQEITSDNAKLIWGLIFRLSPQLRELSEKGTLIEDTAKGIISGENYGKWKTYHPEDGEAIGTNEERVPSPLTNEWAGYYLTNDSQVSNPDWKAIDWDDSLGRIGLSIAKFQ